MKNRNLELFEKFLRNIWKLQNNGKFVSEYNYKKYIKEISNALCLKEDYFINAQLNQLESWFNEMKTKTLFHKNPEKYRSDLQSGFKAFIAYCKFQKGLKIF